MPNPFIRLGQPNQSTVDVERPTGAIEPDEEHYAGPNFPYRGYETHGVKPAGTWRDPSEYEGDYERTADIDVEPIEDSPEPIPVRIVVESGREFKRFRTVRSFSGTINDSPTQVLGRDTTRRKARIKNLSTDTVFIGYDHNSATFMQGYPLVQNETIDIDGWNQVWAQSSTANMCQLTMVIEYSLVENG